MFLKYCDWVNGLTLTQRWSIIIYNCSKIPSWHKHQPNLPKGDEILPSSCLWALSIPTFSDPPDSKSRLWVRILEPPFAYIPLKSNPRRTFIATVWGGIMASSFMDFQSGWYCYPFGLLVSFFQKQSLEVLIF